MILFKSNFPISRDMSDMFKRFQLGRYSTDDEEENAIFQVCIFVIPDDNVNLKKVYQELIIFPLGTILHNHQRRFG